MIRIFDKKECCGCTACGQVCPIKCIVMISDSEGFLYPKVDQSLCIHCGLCERVCPIISAQRENDNVSPYSYAAWNKNDQIRRTSSSGGVFSALAEYILKNRGFVVGAAFRSDFRTVEHHICSSVEELDKLQGSKYLQSEKGDVYVKIKKYLEKASMVLFSGTPCEIEGLRSFLRKPYENLICIDFICHGVPSPKLWNKYVQYREKEAGASTVKTYFRHKAYGWKKFSVAFHFSNKTEYLMPKGKDLYMQMFLQDLCLRPSCYDCQFKKKHRVSDLSLADFWGSENVLPKLDDDKGISLVIVHSEKGSELLESVKDHLEMIAVDLDEALKGNQAMSVSAKVPETREAFMASIDQITIPELARKYLRKPSVLRRLKGLMKPYIPKRLIQMIKHRSRR